MNGRYSRLERGRESTELASQRDFNNLAMRAESAVVDVGRMMKMSQRLINDTYRSHPSVPFLQDGADMLRDAERALEEANEYFTRAKDTANRII